MRHPLIALLTLALLATFTLAATGDQRRAAERIPIDPVPSIEHRLARPVGPRHYKDQSLEAVLHDLAARAGVVLDIRWSDIEAAGVKRDQTITLHTAGYSYASSIRGALELAGRRTVDLEFTIADSAVVISTSKVLADPHFLITRVYDCSEILRLGARGRDIPTAPMDELADTVRAVVAPESWRETGGQSGWVHKSGDRFIITQTLYNHHAINSLFDQLIESYSEEEIPQIFRRPTNAGVYELLQRNVELDIQNVPLKQAVERLGDMLDIHIAVRWDNLPANTITRDTPVSLRTRRPVPAEKAIGLLLNAVSTPQCPLDWTVESASVVIDLPRNLMQVRAYDIRDVIPDPFDDSPTEPILQVIQETIDPSSWKANGGQCTIRILSGQLIVSQLPRNQDRINAFVERLKPPSRNR